MTTTPADEMRAAAEKLRAVSAAAADGPWTIANIPPYTDPVLMSRYDETPADGEVLIVGNVDVSEEDQAHIALMHPGVGLVLAEWLDQAAKRYDATVIGATSVWSDEAAERDAFVAKHTDQHALAVARQVLGTVTECPECGPSGACNGGPCPLGTVTAPPETEQEPVQLRWGLDDVMWGDDDTVTVMLSGPAGEPYWLELDPERAAVLRDRLAGPDGEAQQPAPAVTEEASR